MVKPGRSLRAPRPAVVSRAVPTLAVATLSAVAGLGLALLLFASPGRGAGPGVPFRIVLVNSAYSTLAVDHHGVAYGLSTSRTDPSALYRLYHSTDEGRTWTPLADFPSCSRVTAI